MEYLGGGTLETVLRQGAQEPARALEWLEQTASSLDRAHARGVVHRDVKPANLLLDEQGRVRLGDFGIATAAGLASFTQTGTVLSTVGYLSPEQAQGLPVSSASDRYALGVVAFELLTGTRPFARDTPTAEATAHVHEPVPRASQRNPALPGAVDTVFAQALAKQPAERYPSCVAFVAALRTACGVTDDDVTLQLPPPTIAAPIPITSRPRRHRPERVALGFGLALLALAAAGAGLFAALHHTPGRSAAPTVTRTVTTTTTTAPKTVNPPTALGGSAVAPSASDLNTRGYELMLSGKYPAALPLLQQAVAGLTDPADPVTAYANFNLGQTLVQLGQCTAALPYLQRAAQLETTSREAQNALVYAQRCAAPGAPAATPAGHGAPPSQPPGHGPGHHGHSNQFP
jgi:hypothetical protein